VKVAGAAGGVLGTGRRGREPWLARCLLLPARTKSLGDAAAGCERRGLTSLVVLYIHWRLSGTETERLVAVGRLQPLDGSIVVPPKSSLCSARCCSLQARSTTKEMGVAGRPRAAADGGAAARKLEETGTALHFSNYAADY
jgi:hypothetical protein